MKSKTQPLMLVAICAAFVMQGSTSILSPGINSVAEAFPNIPLPTVMSIGTLPSLFVIIMSLISGRLAGDKVKYKTLVLAGLLFITVAGILPAFLTNFTGILICRAFLGIGVGIIYPLAPVLVVRLYEGNARGHIMGFGQIFATGGGMVMQLLVGFLAVMSWNYIFFIYLLAAICFILVLLCLKEPEKIENTETDTGNNVNIMKLPFKIYFNGVVAFLFMVLSFPVIISVSTVVDVRQLGTSAQAGVALTLFNVGGIVLSAVFGKLYQFMKKWTMIFVLVVTILSMVIVAGATSMWMLYIGMLLFGSGLLLLPALIMDNGQFLPPESVSYASGLMVACMNLGVFFTSPLIAIVFKIVGKADIAAPLYFCMACLGVITILLALTRFKKEKNDASINA